MMRSARWQLAFQNSKSAALRALGSMDTQKVMGIMFGRLYTLCNQLVLLEPEVAKYFPTAQSVNRALKRLISEGKIDIPQKELK